MQKDILLIFKTHLDIGYTDFSKNVVERYINEFIPGAIKLGYELKDSDTPFVWTVGSWLIWEALKSDDGTLEKAIRDGVIAWHALPFTTHTELMNEKLFSYGLSISKELDRRFSKATVAAKMTDVPGHTIGMVPILRKNGVEFLHIGINGATPMPPVPPLFKWRCGDSEITVMYDGGYGTETELDDFILCFGHTGDNCGPQSADAIRKIYAELRENHPGSRIIPSTLDDVAKRLRNSENLPVVDKEIGDTWIHGAGTDPKKVGRYRELMRKIKGGVNSDPDISGSLLLVPEHTWGLCVKRYYPDIDCWTLKSFSKTEDDPDRIIMEKSWAEQREYLVSAEKIMGVSSTDYSVCEPDLEGFEKISDDPGLFVEFELFTRKDYERYREKYIRPPMCSWKEWDFTKVNLPEYPKEELRTWTTTAWQKGNKKIYLLEFPDYTEKIFGLPKVWVEREGENLEIYWIGKKANRLPHALWLKFTGLSEKWQIHKMGQWIDPENITGSPLITAFDRGVRNDEFEIESLDACLAAPFGKRLLDYDLAPSGQDLYFNLYNNIWNTNFPMWYSDDTRFRFVIKKL